MHGVELAGLYAVAETYAGEGTGLVALAAEKHGGAAIFGSRVIEAHFRMSFRSRAGNEGDHFFGSPGSHAHDLGDRGCCSSSAGNALVCGSFASGDCSRISVTSGISASAAVRAGESRPDLLLFRVDLHAEYLGSKREQRAEDASDHSKHEHGQKYCFHISALLIRSSCR